MTLRKTLRLATFAVMIWLLISALIVGLIDRHMERSRPETPILNSVEG